MESDVVDVDAVAVAVDADVDADAGYDVEDIAEGVEEGAAAVVETFEPEY